MMAWPWLLGVGTVSYASGTSLSHHSGCMTDNEFSNILVDKDLRLNLLCIFNNFTQISLECNGEELKSVL